ncbi:hypothetical protein OS493_016355 [Desmophyllum pertusum]|uniref:Uncharacterized protein n=1 Tax=Desmophyllum pertusum TaxID=174260 RepID=A0A9W9ZSR4_9CNID|nr:hypothetical protein OS493_016355 [Desmophyllum pertusum]
MVTQEHCLVENEQESKELAYCDKPAGIDRTNKPDVLDSRESTVEGAETGEEGKLLNGYDKDSTQASQNSCHGKVQSEEDFIAKDLLSFAWQIARGMVSTRISTDYMTTAAANWTN